MKCHDRLLEIALQFNDNPLIICTEPPHFFLHTYIVFDRKCFSTIQKVNIKNKTFVKYTVNIQVIFLQKDKNGCGSRHIITSLYDYGGLIPESFLNCTVFPSDEKTVTHPLSTSFPLVSKKNRNQARNQNT